MAPSPTVLVLLHHNLEETEAVAPIDMLRRAGAQVTTVSLTDSLDITGRNALTLKADKFFSEVEGTLFDMLVLPGGPGVQALRTDERVLKTIQAHVAAQKPVAAICAAPLLLKDAGVLGNHRRTAHASAAGELAPIESHRVVEDELFITSRGAGTAIEFGLACAARLCGAAAAEQVAQSIHFE